jgi:hypothetical protein
MKLVSCGEAENMGAPLSVSIKEEWRALVRFCGQKALKGKFVHVYELSMGSVHYFD